MKKRIEHVLWSAPLTVKAAGIGVATVAVLGAAMAGFVTVHMERVSGPMSTSERLMFLSPFLAIIAGGIVLALALSYALARAIARPMEQLTRPTQRITAGDFSVALEIEQDDEIGALAHNITALARSLAAHRAQLMNRDTERRLLLSRLVDAQEHEKRAIARELHDHFGQMLSLLLLLTSSLRRTTDVAHKSEILDEIDRHIASIIEDVRRLSSDLRPSVLDDYGLDTAVRRQVDFLKTSQAFDVDYTFDNLLDRRLPGPTETALYRIAQEAITNVLRHAEATHVGIHIRVEPGGIHMEIADNGVGFDTRAGAPGSGGIGLSTMEERAALANGSLQVRSKPGGGTRVIVTLPPPAERGTAGHS